VDWFEFANFNIYQYLMKTSDIHHALMAIGLATQPTLDVITVA